jgi:hypothetical protein
LLLIYSAQEERMMKPFKTFLLLAVCVCFSSVVGCSKSPANGQPPPGPAAQSGHTQAAQPAAVAAPTTMPAAGASEQTGKVSDELRTPPKGSAERQALMDALREEYKTRRNSDGKPYRGNITFVVNYLEVHNGWAWTYAEPHSSDPNDQFGENSGFLLHSEDGRWKVMNLPPMVDDPDDPENLDYPSRRDVAKIKGMYPSVPADIFPKQQ